MGGGWQAGQESIGSLFPDFFDPSLRLVSYWAQMEGAVAGDTEAARAVWEGALKSG